ncbi:MAG: class I SAM-dependent methyltransferase [Chloroflexota bacterium]|nr:class I SAM-dependent methyltransferase [Chloroflexota bacterium]
MGAIHTPTEYRPFPNVQWRNFAQQCLELRLLLRVLHIPSGARVLEVGCGRGVALQVIASTRRPAYLAGLDIDARALTVARQALAQQSVDADLRCADVRSLPFDASSFDVVFDFGTCYHIARVDDALREIVRVLRPGGLLIHETPMAQLLSHPVRATRTELPWSAVPELVPYQHSVLWASRMKRE